MMPRGAYKRIDWDGVRDAVDSVILRLVDDEITTMEWDSFCLDVVQTYMDQTGHQIAGQNNGRKRSALDRFRNPISVAMKDYPNWVKGKESYLQEGIHPDTGGVYFFNRQRQCLRWNP